MRSQSISGNMVDILLATFNGEKYIENQLLSLLQQTYKEWRLLISDDGSNDRTIDIIKKYVELDSRIILVNEGSRPKGNKGAAENFMYLTKIAEAPLVMFCDQDDIWFEKKIEIMVNFAKEKFSEEVPSLAYCDGYGYSDEEGIVTINGIAGPHAHSLKDFIFFNSGYQGCSLIFNRKLCGYLSSYQGVDYHMHDDLACLFAYSLGKIFRNNKKLMLYRQHSSNVTGNIEKKNFPKFRDNNFISIKHFNEKKEFFILNKDQISLEYSKIFEGYINFPYFSFWKKMNFLFEEKITYGGSYLKLHLKNIIQRCI